MPEEPFLTAMRKACSPPRKTAHRPARKGAIEIGPQAVVLGLLKDNLRITERGNENLYLTGTDGRTYFCKP